MNFSSRLKKEISEGAVTAFFKNNGFIVIRTGVEWLVREIETMDKGQYKSLGLANGIRSLPDLMIIDRSNSTSFLLEVKYRSSFKVSLLRELFDQVKQCGSLVLVCVTPNALDRAEVGDDPSHLRAAGLRFQSDTFEVEVYGHDRESSPAWLPVDDLGDSLEVWNSFPTMTEKFGSAEAGKGFIATLPTLVISLSGLFSL